MKNILLATTMIVATAGMASADVKNFSFSGYGRFGYVYNSQNAPGATHASLASRLRFNIDAATTSDGGIQFGARIRMESNGGSTSFTSYAPPAPGAIPGAIGTFLSQSGATWNSANFYVVANGLRLEVGNTNTAYDSTALYYNSEMGFQDSSYAEGDYSYYSYDSGPSSPLKTGIFFSYSAGPLNARISYVNPNQYLSTLPTNRQAEVGVSADYVFGQFTVAGAYVQNGLGYKGNNQWFGGVAYAVSSVANIGFNHYNEPGAGSAANILTGGVGGSWNTLYGNYTMGAITAKAYVGQNTTKVGTNGVKQSTAFGLGADYALGGSTRLSGSIQHGFNGATGGDLGVRFDF